MDPWTEGVVKSGPLLSLDKVNRSLVQKESVGRVLNEVTKVCFCQVGSSPSTPMFGKEMVFFLPFSLLYKEG